MEKPTIPTTYLLHGNRVEIMPYFLYEVSIYKITNNMAFLLDSQLYKSDSFLTIKEVVSTKKYKHYSIVRYVNVLGVTREFVEENNLTILEQKKNKKKK